jgi:uncharacterized protein
MTRHSHPAPSQGGGRDGRLARRHATTIAPAGRLVLAESTATSRLFVYRIGNTLRRIEYGAEDRTAMNPSINSTVRVPTAHASRYLQQLCKHWSHNLAVTFSESEGTVTFPRTARGADWPGDATLALQAHADGLDCRLAASSAGQLEALKGAVARHLDDGRQGRPSPCWSMRCASKVEGRGLVGCPR